MVEEKNQFGQTLGHPVNDWQTVDFPKKEILRGRFCVLDPINLEKYADQLFQNLLVDNPGDTWTYLPYGPFNNSHEFKEWLLKTDARSDTQLYVILNLQNEPIGVCGYLRVTPEHGVIEVGHLHYSKFLQRTPMATEAMYLMMRYAFDDLHYRRYEWKCNALNEPSRQAAFRLGFKFEGTFRQNNVFKNYNRDTDWFSIIDSEWPEIKNRFQRWLAPENFDSSGKQILSLRDV